MLMKKKIDLSWVAQIQQKGRKDNTYTTTQFTYQQQNLKNR